MSVDLEKLGYGRIPDKKADYEEVRQGSAWSEQDNVLSPTPVGGRYPLPTTEIIEELCDRGVISRPETDNGTDNSSEKTPQKPPDSTQG